MLSTSIQREATDQQEPVPAEQKSEQNSEQYEQQHWRRLVLMVEYDGTKYAGWQRQSNALAVQQVLEHTIGAIAGVPVSVIGAGRTDAGVHAAGQVVHCNIPDDFPVPARKIPVALNTRLPNDIRVMAAVITDKPFHARFDASAREYSYALSLSQSVFYRHYTWQPRCNINIGLLYRTAEMFLGTHDFTTFSKLNTDTHSYVCAVEASSWRRLDNDLFIYTVRADRFVYGMVRSIVGTMVEVARGRREADDVAYSLSQIDRTRNSPLAPARGLVLRRIYYPDNPFQMHAIYKPMYGEEREHGRFYPH